MAPMRVAIVHEWLVTYAGSERVLEQMAACYPQADLFATVDFLGVEERRFLQGRPVRTTFIQRLPFARRKYQQYLPLMPLAVEQHDLSGYDVVISSSHAVAKGVLTGPDQLHLCMCYTPARYAWDLQHQYLRQSGLLRGPKAWLARWLLHRFRIWDARTAAGVDEFIAISHYVARRIRKTYRRESAVIYPPVDVEAFPLHEAKEPFYLAASRMAPYKRMDVIVEAFRSLPERELVVVGDGPDFARLKARCPPNVRLLGHLPHAALLEQLQRARALLFAAEEDFGILPAEAQACGTPVIAYGRGGAAEIVRGLEHERPTGVFFPEQTPEAVRAAVADFEREAERIAPAACRENAERFGIARFRREFTAFVEERWERFQREIATDAGAGAARAGSAAHAGSPTAAAAGGASALRRP
jgi:glycosyltransferase involved in cell wall biosynthesis